MVTSTPSDKLAETRNLDEVEHFSLRLIGCKHCHNTDIVKYGTYKGRQRYFCNACQRKFADTNALPGKRFPAEQVGAAVGMFYRGLSTQEIGQQLAQQYSIPAPSKSTVYRWVTEYTRYALKQTGSAKATTGNTWVADETVIKVGGKNYWLWDVMDVRSRYILASRLSATRYTKDAEIVFRQAAQQASHPPKVIVTDRLRSYIDGIERVFGSDSKHVQSGGIRAEINNNLSERLQGTVKQRTKVMRGLQNRETAQQVIDGWAFHYNYFKPHESLKGKTPAEVAKATSPFANWEDVARHEPVFEQPLRERRLRDRTFTAGRRLPEARYFRRRAGL